MEHFTNIRQIKHTLKIPSIFDVGGEYVIYILDAADVLRQDNANLDLAVCEEMCDLIPDYYYEVAEQ